MKNLLPNTIIILAIGILLYSSFSLVLYFKSDAFDLLSGTFIPDMKNLFQSNLIGAITGETFPIKPKKTEASSTAEKPSESLPSAKTSSQNNYSPAKNSSSGNTTPVSVITPVQTNNNLIDTFITSGPKEGEVVEGTDQVKFEFKAITILTQNENDIIFETKVLGLDAKWQTSYTSFYNNQRIIYLPAGPAQYTFLVRAKYKNITDPTPSSITFKVNNSFYYGKIRFNSVQFKTSPYSSTISLSSYLNNGEKVNITGWLLESRNGSFTIPQGVEKYDSFNYFTQDILLKNNDRVYFSESASPFGNTIKAFRLNKCFGYLTNYQTFTIYFYKNCPVPEEQDVLYFRPACQKYLLNINRCQEPRYWENFEISLDSECVSYINNYFNYANCLKNYSQGSDFFENEWHIYMQRTILVRGIGQVILRDKNGYLVDKYIYEYPRY